MCGVRVAVLSRAFSGARIVILHSKFMKFISPLVHMYLDENRETRRTQIPLPT
jgi:hypothetical protein